MVSDFGLTEDMYSTAYYRHDGCETGTEEKIPIKCLLLDCFLKLIVHVAHV